MAGFPDEDESSEQLLHHSQLKSNYSSKTPTESNGTCYMVIYLIIIQHIVTLPKYGHGELNICRPHMTDILRYT